MRVWISLAAWLAVLAPVAALADPTEAQKREAQRVSETPFVGGELEDAVYYRFAGVCNARTSALGRARMQLDWLRQGLATGRQSDANRVSLDLADSALRRELAQPCTQSAEEREFAEAARDLPQLPVDVSATPAPGTDYRAQMPAVNAVRDDTLRSILANTDRCDIPAALQLFSSRRRYVLRLRQQAEAARGSGNLSPQEKIEAIARYFRELGTTEDFYLDFMALRVECDKRQRERLARTLPLRPAPVQPAPPATDPAPLAAPPSTTDNPCFAPTQTRMFEICRRAAALLGRWTSKVHGGIIETTITPDGKIEGRIAAANAHMLSQGYEPGMRILRGYSGQPSTSTWLAVARGGEFFLAKHPDRKSGEPYGDALWQGGVVIIEVRKPDTLMLPAALENRISRYDPWVRMGSQAAQPR